MTIKTASARDMVPQQTLDQIGRMNLMAISGFRWSMDANGDMLLPISSGYRVRISLDANDTYTVTREMKRGDKIFVKGSQSDVYAEDLGEVCYQASSYKSNDWGGHVVGASRTAAKPRYYLKDTHTGMPGNAFNDLGRARKELEAAVGDPGRWELWDRQTKERVAAKTAGTLPGGLDWDYDIDTDYSNVEGGLAVTVTVYDDNGDVVDSLGGITLDSLDVSDHGNVIVSSGDEQYLQEVAEGLVGDMESTAMTHPHREAHLLEALEYATPREAVRITSELDGLRRAARLRRETGHDIDWDAVHSGVPGGPVPPGLHTAHTDWMAECDPAVTPERVRQAAKREARHWLAHLDPVIFDYPEELEKQAIDHVAVWSSGYANSSLAHRSFVGALTTLLSPSTATMMRMTADDDTKATANLADCMAQGTHLKDVDDEGYCTVCGDGQPRKKGSRRTAADDDSSGGSTCSVCGASIERDPAGEEPRTWHHNDGDKHDHEAKPSGGDSKESRFRRVASILSDVGSMKSGDKIVFGADGAYAQVWYDEFDAIGDDNYPTGNQGGVWEVVLKDTPDLVGGRQLAAIRRFRFVEPKMQGWQASATADYIISKLHDTRRRGMARTAATGSELRAQHSDLFSGADAAYDAEDSSWFDNLGMDDLLILWDSVSGYNFIDMEGPWDDEVYEALADKGYEFPVKESRRHTAADPSLREVEQWCDTQGLIMKDFPDSLIDQAAESGDMSILDDWLETHEPRLTGTDPDAAPYSSVDTSRDFSYYD